MPRRFGRLADYQIFNPRSEPRMAKPTKSLFPDPPAEQTSEVSKPASDEPKLIRPVKRLADEPDVATDNDIQIALTELVWIDNKEKTAAKLQDVELDLVRKKYLKHFQVDSHATAPEGEPAPQTLAQRRQQLEQAITAYATKHKKTLLEGDSKTKDFGIGTIAFKLCPLSLMATAKETKDVPKPLDAALQALLAANEIPQMIEKKLKVKPEGVNRPLADLLRVSFAWNAAGIVALVKDEKMTSADFKPIGLKVDRNDERVEIRLKA